MTTPTNITVGDERCEVCGNHATYRGVFRLTDRVSHVNYCDRCASRSVLSSRPPNDLVPLIRRTFVPCGNQAVLEFGDG